MVVSQTLVPVLCLVTWNANMLVLGTVVTLNVRLSGEVEGFIGSPTGGTYLKMSLILDTMYMNGQFYIYFKSVHNRSNKISNRANS